MTAEICYFSINRTGHSCDQTFYYFKGLLRRHHLDFFHVWEKIGIKRVNTLSMHMHVCRAYYELNSDKLHENSKLTLLRRKVSITLFLFCGRNIKTDLFFFFIFDILWILSSTQWNMFPWQLPDFFLFPIYCFSLTVFIVIVSMLLIWVNYLLSITPYCELDSFSSPGEYSHKGTKLLSPSCLSNIFNGCLR